MKYISDSTPVWFRLKFETKYVTEKMIKVVDPMNCVFENEFLENGSETGMVT